MNAPPILAAHTALRGARTASAGRLWRGTFYTAALFCLMLVAALYVVGVTQERQEAREVALAAQNAQSRAELEDGWIRDAVRQQRVLVGMNAAEVLAARGRPFERRMGPQLLAPERELGGAEAWLYERAQGVCTVLFDVAGLVVYSSDVAGKQVYGNAVRQR